MNIVTLQANIFTDTSNLRHVNLSSNYLVSLEPQILKELPKLESLDISYNLFMGLDAEFLNIGKKCYVCLVKS